jgi:hypothetical protein
LSCPEGAYSISPGTDLIEKGMKDALSKGFKEIYLEPGIHTSTTPVKISVEGVTISGAGRGITLVEGNGFVSIGRIGQTVLMDMTVQKTETCGMWGNGLYAMSNFHCLRMHFDQCGGEAGVCLGVCLGGMGKIKGRLTNCQITQCEGSGVKIDGGGNISTIEIEGEETIIELNNSRGRTDNYIYYGLDAYKQHTSIHILSPLTKESISKDNRDGNNFEGDVQTVQSF